MMAITLGLDLGPSSIGWALINSDANRIIDLGVRIFPEGVNNFDTLKEMSRNVARRNARMLRRQTRRRAERKQRVRQTLIELGLFPVDPADQKTLYDADDSNPYALRAQALDEKVSLHELGRILLHLNQRRGFKSNRKSDRKNSEVSGMLAEMSELKKAIKDKGTRTYGEFLYQKSQSLNHTARELDDHLRGRRTQRDWLTEEFDLIWKAQQKHHPEVLTDHLAYGKIGPLKPIHKPIAKNDPRRKGAGDLESFGLFGLLFFHRSLKPVPKEVVGNCELEPKQKRCHRADRQAQRFRLLQDVNNLRMIDGSASPPIERVLNEQERALVLDKLMQTEEASFDQIRKWVAKLPDSPAQEQIRFNLEEGKRKKLQGMITDARLAAGGKSGAVGKSWYNLDEGVRDAVVRELIHNLDDNDKYERLIDMHALTPEQADGALSIDLTECPTKGYVNLSRLAISKLLPYLQNGMLLMANDETDSAMHAAGYLRRDQKPRRIFDELPDPERIHDAPIGDTPNPVARRAVVELRKVVNAIIREQRRQRNDPQWKPDAVHVEMARELRQGPVQRKERASKMREIEAERDHAKQVLHDNRQPYGSRGSNIVRVQLWEQQHHDCPYCGQGISQGQLFKDEQVDVDHILPYSRTLDDSQMNKVVCHRECNATKGDKTPYEWKADSDPDGYVRILQYAGHLPYRKRQRFLQRELKLDDFIARQLTATGYIAKATIEYIKCLFDQKHAVIGIKGHLSAELRRQWGLNDVLRNDGLGIKTSDDHRHHAVNAIVIAMTDRSRLRALSKIHKRGGTLTTGEALEYPWDNFRDDAIAKLNMLDGGKDEAGQQRGISHRVQRKAAGVLHKDTVYGPVRNTLGQRKEGTFVVRKSLESLSANEVDKIRDGAIKAIVKQRLAEHGIEVGWGKKPDPRKWKDALCNVNNPLTMPSGVPIKRVRVIREEQSIQPIRQERAEKQDNPDLFAWVKPGATHHLCIFEFMKSGKKKRDAVFVTQLEATSRIKRQQQELAKRMTQCKRDGVNKHEAKRLKAQAMREIAAQFPLIQRDASKLDDDDRRRIPANAAFVMSLSKGELALVDWKGEEKLLKFKTSSSTQSQIWFSDHTDARKSTKYKKYFANANTLRARKVTIDPLGRVRWAND